MPLIAVTAVLIPDCRDPGAYKCYQDRTFSLWPRISCYPSRDPGNPPPQSKAWGFSRRSLPPEVASVACKPPVHRYLQTPAMAARHREDYTSTVVRRHSAGQEGRLDYGVLLSIVVSRSRAIMGHESSSELICRRGEDTHLSHDPFSG